MLQLYRIIVKILFIRDILCNKLSSCLVEWYSYVMYVAKLYTI